MTTQKPSSRPEEAARRGTTTTGHQRPPGGFNTNNICFLLTLSMSNSLCAMKAVFELRVCNTFLRPFQGRHPQLLLHGLWQEVPAAGLPDHRCWRRQQQPQDPAQQQQEEPEAAAEGRVRHGGRLRRLRPRAAQPAHRECSLCVCGLCCSAKH